MAILQIDLSSIPPQPFTARCRKSAVSGCKGKDPEWLTTALSSGVQLDLTEVMVQAGRHFSDSINRSISSVAKKRQAATALAWALGSMLNPSVVNGKLYVEDPNDSDVVRLCSEIFGVGIGLESLRKLGVIDGRSIGKLSGRFDFEALSKSGNEYIGIEAKGTFKNGAGTGHRASMTKKFSNETWRKYNRNIGVICALRTVSEPGRFDLEICDPSRDGKDYREKAIREVILFYARRFDECVGNREGVAILAALANDPLLFKEDRRKHSTPFGDQRHPSRKFWRVRLRLAINGRLQEYLGAFWDPRVVPIPIPKDLEDDLLVKMSNEQSAATLMTFQGVNAEVFNQIREHNFDDLLAYEEAAAGTYVCSSAEPLFAAFHLDPYGIVRGLTLGEVPKEMTLAKRRVAHS